jgi:hypothetical protein
MKKSEFEVSTFTFAKKSAGLSNGICSIKGCGRRLGRANKTGKCVKHFSRTGPRRKPESKISKWKKGAFENGR